MYHRMTSPLIPHVFTEAEWDHLKSGTTEDAEKKAYQLLAEKCYWKAHAIMLFCNIPPKNVSAFHLKAAETRFHDKEYDLAFELLLQVIYHPAERKLLLDELSSKSVKAHNYLKFHHS